MDLRLHLYRMSMIKGIKNPRAGLSTSAGEVKHAYCTVKMTCNYVRMQ